MMSATVGVDVGGTKIAAGLIDDDGAVVRHDRRATDSSNYQALLDGVSGAVREVAVQTEISGVGLAIAGNVTADGSTVLFSPHLPLDGEPLARDLRQVLDLPVRLDNDANAAAWAEHQVGAGRGSAHMLFVALGTGLGAGLVLGNRLYLGHLGFAGEAGHMTVVADGRLCPCGARGCWERYASGTALVGQYLELGGDPDLGGPGITEAATQGDTRAQAALADVGDWLGRGLASLVAVLDPEIIVVGGGVSLAGDLLLEPARMSMARHMTGGGRRPSPAIVPATLGNEAGIVGAALLVRDHSG